MSRATGAPAGVVEGIWATESAASPRGGAGGVRFLLVHGSLDRSAGLLKLSRRLTALGPVVRFDRRGYGRSVPHDGPFTIGDQVGDAGRVIDRFDDGLGWVVVGHSYGADVGLALAVASMRVSAVVAYEPPLSWLPWWPHATAGGEAVGLVAATASSDERDGEAAEAFMRRLIGDDRWERMPTSRRAARRREGRALVAELVDLRRAAPWSPEAIDVPVLAMAGTASREHHRRAAREVGATVPGADHLELDGAAHFGPNTHPDAVAAAIDAFLRRRGLI